jgi:hypothetical protein
MHVKNQELEEDVILVDDDGTELEWARILVYVDPRHREQCKNLILVKYATSYMRYCFGHPILLDTHMQPCFMSTCWRTHESEETQQKLGAHVFYRKRIPEAIGEYTKTGQPLYRLHQDLQTYFDVCAKERALFEEEVLLSD